MTVLCKSLRALPQAGGLLDQDSYLVYGMYLCLEAFGKREENEAKKEQAKARARTPRRH